jgi:hypothetical protein
MQQQRLQVISDIRIITDISLLLVVAVLRLPPTTATTDHSSFLPQHRKSINVCQSARTHKHRPRVQPRRTTRTTIITPYIILLLVPVIIIVSRVLWKPLPPSHLSETTSVTPLVQRRGWSRIVQPPGSMVTVLTEE